MPPDGTRRRRRFAASSRMLLAWTVRLECVRVCVCVCACSFSSSISSTETVHCLGWFVMKYSVDSVHFLVNPDGHGYVGEVDAKFQVMLQGSH